jgi:mRNA interferase MazF
VALSCVPEAGDILWPQFDPQAGREQAGHRPAIVLSPASYNFRAGMIVCCPTTTRIKGYPVEVALAGSPPSVVLADQVRSQHWRARKASQKGRVSPAELAAVRAMLIALISPLPSGNFSKNLHFCRNFLLMTAVRKKSSGAP